jgi:hypothetical protein
VPKHQSVVVVVVVAAAAAAAASAGAVPCRARLLLVCELAFGVVSGHGCGGGEPVRAGAPAGDDGVKQHSARPALHAHLF